MCRERKLLTTWPWLNIHLLYFWSGAAKTKRHQSFHLEECSRLTWYQVFWCMAQKPTDERVAVLCSALLCFCFVILHPYSVDWTACCPVLPKKYEWTIIVLSHSLADTVKAICSVSLTKNRAFIYWCSAGDSSRGHIWCCHEIRGEENSIIAITLRRLSKIDQQ